MSEWSCSVMSDSATPWTVAYQAPPSMRFSRQEYWSGLPFPSPGDLPNSGIEPGSPAFQADALNTEPPGKPSVIQIFFYVFMWSFIIFACKSCIFLWNFFLLIYICLLSSITQFHLHLLSYLLCLTVIVFIYFFCSDYLTDLQL